MWRGLLAPHAAAVGVGSPHGKTGNPSLLHPHEGWPLLPCQAAAGVSQAVWAGWGWLAPAVPAPTLTQVLLLQAEYLWGAGGCAHFILIQIPVQMHAHCPGGGGGIPAIQPWGAVQVVLLQPLT